MKSTITGFWLSAGAMICLLAVSAVFHWRLLLQENNHPPLALCTRPQPSGLPCYNPLLPPFASLLLSNDIVHLVKPI